MPIDRAALRSAGPFPEMYWALGDDFNAMTPDFYRRLLRVTFTDTDVGMDTVEVLLDNSDLGMFGDTNAAKGIGDHGPATARVDIFPNAIWTIRMGYPDIGQWTQLQDFQVKEVQGFRRIKVTAYDKTMIDMNEVAKKRAFTGPISRAQVAVQVAQDAGLQIVSHPNDGSTVQATRGIYSRIVQPSISDAQFIQRLARSVGFVWFIEVLDEETRIFHFHERNFAATPIDTIRWGEDEDIIGEPTIDVNLLTITKSALGSAIDPFEKIRARYKASNNATSRQVSGTATYNDESALPVRQQTEITPEEAAAIPPIGAITPDQLAEEVDAVYKRLEETFMSLRVRMVGNPRFVAGATIDIEGIGEFGGRFYIAEAKHSIEPGSGYTTELELLRNAVDDSTPIDIQNRLLVAATGQNPIPAAPDPLAPNAANPGVFIRVNPTREAEILNQLDENDARFQKILQSMEKKPVKALPPWLQRIQPKD